MASPESGRPMRRGDKLIVLTVGEKQFPYRQPGWWCSLDDPNDLEGQLVDQDSQVAEMARRTAEAMAKGETFTPLLIRAIRLRCGLSQREAGKLFQTGEKSFEKYESGKIRPSGPTRLLLWLALSDPDLLSKPPGKETSEQPPVPDPKSIRRAVRGAGLGHYYDPMFQQSVAAAKGQPFRVRG